MATFNPFAPLRNLSYFAIVGLALMGVADLFSTIIGAAQILSPDSALDLDDGDVMSVWLMLQGLVYLLKVPLYIFTVVMFLIWLYRAHSNLEPLRGSNLQFTPGWTVGWWFIPFANLVKPFQAVREVWAESDPDVVPDREPMFLSGSFRSAPTYMAIWWGFWLLSNFASNITGRVYDPDTMANVGIGGVLFVVTGVLSVIAAVLAVMVVRDITDRQTLRFENLSRSGNFADTPPPPPMFPES